MRYLCVLWIVLIIGLTGCGNNNSLTDYQRKMERFYDTLNDYDTAINSLDPELDSAVSDLLEYLDGIAAAIHEMAGFDVPEGFPGVLELAVQADEHMAEAVSLYRRAYEADEYNENYAEAAREYYERVNLRLKYIADILRGDIPEEIFVYD